LNGISKTIVFEILPWQFLDFSLLISFDQAKESKLIVKLKLTCYQKLKLFNIKKIHENIIL